MEIFTQLKKEATCYSEIQMLHLMTAGGLDPLTGEPDSLTLTGADICSEKNIFSTEALGKV